MALSIVWNEGISRTCGPGSLLAGNVQLLAHKQQPVGQVSVTFAGRCKVRIERSNGQTTTYYHSKGYYFSQRQVLHEGDFTFQAGTYTWPFRFVMPAYANPGLIQSQKGKGDVFKPNPPWRGTESQELHPLPTHFNGPKRCSVEYYLKAQLNPPRQGASLFSRTIDEKVMLDFRPLMVRPDLDPDFHKHGRKFSIQTLKLLPEDSEERHSFRHKLKGVFQSSSLPELRLQVEVSMPRRVVSVPGTAVPCLVSVRRCATAAEDTRQVPQSSVHVRRFELGLRCHTEARTRAHQDHKRETIILGAGSGTAIWIQNAEDASADAKLAYETDDGGAATTTDVGALNGARLPAGVTPDFSTYNVAHYHSLELRLRLECAGEGMNFDIKHLPIEIAPQTGQQDPPPWEQSHHDGGMSIEQRSDIVSPPSYTYKEEPQRLSNQAGKGKSNCADEWD